MACSLVPNPSRPERLGEGDGVGRQVPEGQLSSWPVPPRGRKPSGCLGLPGDDPTVSSYLRHGNGSLVHFRRRCYKVKT